MIRFDRAMDALRRNDLGLYLIVGLLTVITTTTALELWDLRWNVPIGYSGDAILIASHIKTDLETGWYESQSLLGAPFGQVYHDWKSADNLHHMVVSAMRLFVHDWGVAINLYYLLGYLLAALTATWFLRLVGVSRTITVALAVLYGIAPYHFIRGEHHMWLSAYYPIPLALGVVYLIASGRPLWQSRAGRGRVLGALTGRGAFVAVALALVATANSYYGFFTVLLIALAGLIRLIADHDWRRFVGAVAAGVITAGVMLLNMLPDIVYSALHGSNAVAVGRLPVEAELYSLKFMQLVLPMPDHRVPILRSLRTLYDTLYPFTAESPALGIVAAVGFVSALGFTLYTLLARFRGGAAAWSPRRTAFGILSGLILFCFLLSTFGGLSSLVSFFTSDLRGWNRMSIVIAMLSLAATGLLVDALVGRIVRRYAAVRAFPVVAAATASALLLGVGYLDQVSPLRVPDYAATTAEYDADAEMVGRIEQLVPEGAMILQLPFRQFPETPPINGVYDTDQLKPYLHSDTLRWSGGAIKGRPSSEWPGLASVLPTDGFIRAVAAAGFSGVLVDRRPYEDDGRKIVAELREAIGEEAFSAQDGRYLFFELGDDLTDGLSAGDRADLGEWIVRPLYARFVPDYGRGFTIPETLGAYKPSILLDNPRDEPMRVRLDFTLAYAQGDAVLRFTAPDGSFTDLPVSADPDDVSIEVDAPPGRSTITVTVVEGPQPEKGRTNSGPIVVTELTGHDLELEATIERIASER